MAKGAALHLFGIIILSMGVYWGAHHFPAAGADRSKLASVAAVSASGGPKPRPGAPRLELGARAFFSLYVAPTGELEILAERQSDEPLPIASLTKLMTARVVSQNYEPQATVTIAPSDLEVPPDPAFLQPGQEFTLAELRRSLLIESSNASAEALARVVGRPRFVAEMNRQAKELGLANTYYFNPSGLDEAPTLPVNHASARDLAFLAKAILAEQPEIFDISRLVQSPIVTANGQFHHLAINTDKLLGGPLGEAEIIGSKTGQTDLARKNLLLVLKDKKTGAYLLNVVLGAPDHFADMKNLTEWLYQAYEF